MGRGRADPEPVRPASPADAEMIARLHVACWREAYAGLLPESEIARRGVAERSTLWSRVLHEGQLVHVAPGLGFAQMAYQREGEYAARGYTAELWCLYVLARAQGTGIGLRLLRAAAAETPHAFTACVIEGNARALAFYRKTGAEILATRADKIGETPITEHVLGWSGAAARALAG